jgi:hypothetical protein
LRPKWPNFKTSLLTKSTNTSKTFLSKRSIQGQAASLSLRAGHSVARVSAGKGRIALAFGLHSDGDLANVTQALLGDLAYDAFIPFPSLAVFTTLDMLSNTK